MASDDLGLEEINPPNDPWVEDRQSVQFIIFFYFFIKINDFI